ncbi:uncharacterized protein KZ484_013085 [Pholidichthys leucotaenia]
MDFSQQPFFSREDFLPEHQLRNLERNSIMYQEKTDPPQIKVKDEDPDPQQLKQGQEEPDFAQIKEEKEEVCASHEGELLVVKLEADACMVTPKNEENNHSEVKSNIEQLSHNCADSEIKYEEGSWHTDSGSAKEEEPRSKARRLPNRSDNDSLTKSHRENKTDFSQQPAFSKEDVLPDHQLCNLGRNSIMDQEKTDPPQIKQEQEEVCASHEGELLVVKVEADNFMVTPKNEENDHSEVKPNTEQNFHNSADSEIKNEEGSWNTDSRSAKEEPRPKKRHLPNRGDNDSLMSTTLWENKTEDPQLHDCEKNEEAVEVITSQQLCSEEKLYSCEICGKRFHQISGPGAVRPGFADVGVVEEHSVDGECNTESGYGMDGEDDTENGQRLGSPPSLAQPELKLEEREPRFDETSADEVFMDGTDIKASAPRSQGESCPEGGP